MAVNQQHPGNSRNNFFYKLFLCCLVTLGVMYAHRFLPPKTLSMVPSKGVKAYIYADNNSAGESMVSWTDYDGLAWQCVIEEGNKQHSCGFNVDLGASMNAYSKSIDLSGYDRINLELDYSGPDKRLRLYTRNFVEGFSTFDDPGTFKYSNVLMPTQFVAKPLSIQFSEFSVAEWWINDYQVPREFMHPDFNNTTAFGIDLLYDSAAGVHHFKLKKLQFVGLWISTERWYLSILIFWMLVIFTGGGYNFWQLKRQSRAERVRLETLISQNSALEYETNRYKQLSMLDQLTGMLNRHGLSEFLQKNYQENSQRAASLIIIDIDFFKKINDAYGHDGGDAVLHTVAETIRQNIRSHDVAARWGGEEFVVVLPDTTAEEARVVAEELRSLVATSRYETLPSLQVTISAGVGAIEGAEPFHMLFRRVDVALYQAKAQGRNRVIMAVK